MNADGRRSSTEEGSDANFANGRELGMAASDRSAAQRQPQDRVHRPQGRKWESEKVGKGMVRRWFVNWRAADGDRPRSGGERSGVARAELNLI
jgi:hypothetical protein